jgi:hypothetical protein
MASAWIAESPMAVMASPDSAKRLIQGYEALPPATMRSSRPWGDSVIQAEFQMIFDIRL